MDKVYLKKRIKSDVPFEKHPNLVFGLILIGFAVLIVASIFLMWMVPVGVLAILWIVCIGLLVWWIVKKNEKTNLSKSSAFIKRDGKLHYIRLGYSLDGDIPARAVDVVFMGPVDAAMAARAQENTIKTNIIREMREKPEVFSRYLDQILTNGGRLPEFVIEYCFMPDPHVEKKTKDWMWISYANRLTGGREVKKVRNAYDLEL